MMAQNYLRTDLIVLRTVSIFEKNGDRLTKVNALLDDASIQTYINTDVASELDLHGKTAKGHGKCFEWTDRNIWHKTF